MTAFVVLRKHSFSERATIFLLETAERARQFCRLEENAGSEFVTPAISKHAPLKDGAGVQSSV